MQVKKKCTSCGLTLDICNFHKSSSGAHGVRAICKDCRNKATREDYHKDIEKSREGKRIASANYRRKHAKTLPKKWREYQKNRRKDQSYRLHCSISTAINKNISKTMSTNKYLDMFGYTITELKEHLEKQFTEGMTWDNWGRAGMEYRTWQIDHIKPRSAFDFSNKSEILECWSLNNLQPLWSEDNLSKGGKWHE